MPLSFFSRSATIYPSVFVISFDDVVVLFRINYSHPEVSCITRAKSCLNWSCQTQTIKPFLMALSAPPLSRSAITQLPRPSSLSPFPPPLSKVLLLESKWARSPLKLWGYSRSSHYHGDAKTVFDSQAKH